MLDQNKEIDSLRRRIEVQERWLSDENAVITDLCNRMKAIENRASVQTEVEVGSTRFACKVEAPENWSPDDVIKVMKAVSSSDDDA